VVSTQRRPGLGTVLSYKWPTEGGGDIGAKQWGVATKEGESQIGREEGWRKYSNHPNRKVEVKTSFEAENYLLTQEIDQMRHSPKSLWMVLTLTME